MGNMSKGNIWAACAVFGAAIGFILTYVTSPSFGFPVGALLGTGTAFVLTGLVKSGDR
jgi:hypothetical protein